MRRKEKMDTAIPVMAVTGFLVLGVIWCSDSIFRFLHKPDSRIACIDERYTETEAMINREETDEPPETESDKLYIKDAAFTFVSLPQGYITIQKSEETMHNGLLLYLDDTCPFSGTVSNLNDIFQHKNDYYRLKNAELQAQENTIRAMNALTEAYYQETGQKNLLIYSTTASYSAEGTLYPDFFPDRSTGFCLDLAFLNADDTISKINQENCPWLQENAWRFGFVFSVPEADYHIRYVGKLHAAIIKKQNLTLTAYLDMLRDYSVSEPYRYADEEKNGLIYFVPASVFSSTDIPVPDKENYELSGNNTDGYFVWTDG